MTQLCSMQNDVYNKEEFDSTLKIYEVCYLFLSDSTSEEFDCSIHLVEFDPLSEMGISVQHQGQIRK